jgi:hypothetical protein
MVPTDKSEGVARLLHASLGAARHGHSTQTAGHARPPALDLPCRSPEPRGSTAWGCASHRIQLTRRGRAGSACLRCTLFSSLEPRKASTLQQWRQGKARQGCMNAEHKFAPVRESLPSAQALAHHAAQVKASSPDARLLGCLLRVLPVIGRSKALAYHAAQVRASRSLLSISSRVTTGMAST